MPASYVYRMDDIAPGMDRSRFERFIDMFRTHGVRPLLGVVPQNEDPTLNVAAPDPRFWDRIRELVHGGGAEVAQHGYRHVYDSRRYGILGRRFGCRPQSEFAGLPYDVQHERIRAGQEILRQASLATDVWMAPSHSFDTTTLDALERLGFGAVTDGMALYPYRRRGLTFVPQQLWRPKAMRFGVWTICLHSNTTEEVVFDLVRRHLESGAPIIPFSEARLRTVRRLDRWANLGFEYAYMLNIARHRLRDDLRARRTRLRSSQSPTSPPPS